MLMDSPVIRFVNKMADLLLLNILYILCCIPIVTIGAATTALYHVTLRSIRYGDGYVVSEFIRSFKQNLLSSTLIWLLVVVVGAILGLDLYFWLKVAKGGIRIMMTGVNACILFVYLITVLYIFPVQAKLKNSIWLNIRNAAAMAIGHLFPYTMICVAITGGFVYLFYVSLAADLIAILIGFSLLAYIQSFFFYKVFAKYIEEDPVGEDDPLYGINNK
ncbi:YesL family protein [Anaerosporobacter faecicola]|uniref:YesL family protein n=1 Tax=Anaerosporobacter faecicola TaxID=2718714 RepID=UPI00143C188B|nr:DUF624 domain-containing protein [Anaerosporobacter faecicola]